MYASTDLTEVSANDCIQLTDFTFSPHVVRPNYSTIGTFIAPQRRVFAAESVDPFKLREGTGQSNGFVQIPRFNSHFTQRMRLFAKVCALCDYSATSEIDIVVFLRFYRQSGAVSQQQHLLLLLPSIRQTEQIIRKFWIDVYRSGNINMKKLFVEMLESVSK